jgi:hypothetical protein
MPQSIGLNIRLILEWLPAAHFLQAIAIAAPGHPRVLEVVKLVEFLSDKTDSPIDDELCQLVKEILLTPQGQKLVDYVTDKVRSLSNVPN